MSQETNILTAKDGSRMAMAVLVAALLSIGPGGNSARGQNTTRPEAKADTEKSDLVPQFKLDAAWHPKLPNKWVLGWVSGVNVDSKDHVWILHRPGTLKPEDRVKAAPPVLELDADGNFIQGWGGPS